MNNFGGRVAATCESSAEIDNALRRSGRIDLELIFSPLNLTERTTILEQ